MAALQSEVEKGRGDGKFICHSRIYVLISFYYGAIAQLGERLHGMQEVVGSNPIGSILLEKAESNTNSAYEKAVGMKYRLAEMKAGSLPKTCRDSGCGGKLQ